MRFRFHPKIKTGWKNKLVLILLVIILVFFLINLGKSWQKNRQIDTEVNDLKTNIETTQKDNQQLKELIQYFNSTAYIEEQARTNLGLKKQGESVIIVPVDNQNNTNLDNTDQSQNQAQPQTNPQKWWQYFFK